MSKRKRESIFLSGSEIARFIDQSLLKPQATEADIIRLCKGAIRYNFYSVCVSPYYVPLCKALLRGHDVKVTTVVGFPFGMTLKDIKTKEARQSVLFGADELDVVMNIGAAKSGNWDYVHEELSELIKATKQSVHKVIIETCYLNDKEKAMAVRVAISSGAAFIKTSTGFGTKGATVKDVRLIKKITKDKVGIKAAGGIKTFEQALSFIKAGATRIGTSSGEEIVRGAMKK